jgi:hypothetical protein
VTIRRQPQELFIPLTNFLYRIAWFELQGQKREADALRQLAADFQPAYRVDETLVEAMIAHLRSLDDASPL